MSSFIIEALRDVEDTPSRFSDEHWAERTERVSRVRERLENLRRKKAREYDAIRAADTAVQP